MNQTAFLRFEVVRDRLIRLSLFWVFCWTLIVLWATPLWANETIATAITGAKIVTQPGEVIESGTLVIRDGLIEAVGVDIEVPFDAKQIDGAGLVIYAGFIDAGTTKGLPEGDEDTRQTGSGVDRRDIDLATQIAAATHEVNRKGIFPDYPAARFVDIDDDDAKAWRQAGFTTVHVMPTGEIMNGTSVVVALANPDTTPTRDRILRDDFAAIAGWRSSGRGYPTSLMGSVAHLRQTLLDAQHYQTSWEIFDRVQRGIKPPPHDPAMEAVGEILKGEMPVVFPASNIDEVYRAQSLADEFGFDVIFEGVQHGYKLVGELTDVDVPLILRLDFPDKPELGENPGRGSRGFGGRRRPSSDEEQEIDKRIPVARGILEDRTEKWESRVKNAATLAEAGVAFVFSTNGSKDIDTFVENLRLAIEHGLSADDALRGLTVQPAKLFGLDNQLGTIEAGKVANLVAMTGDLADKETKVKYTIVNGEMFEFKEDDENGDARARGRRGGRRGGAGRRGQSEPDEQTQSESSDEEQEGDEEKDEDKEEEEEEDEEEIQVVDWPIETDQLRIPATQTGGNVFIEKANVVTAVNGTLANTSILIRDGLIESIGPDLTPPQGFTVIDGQGCWVMPGIIDCHSHMVAGGNEGSLSVTPEVRAIDNMRSDDLTVYRAAAGGVTAANVLHGSANTIGGQRVVIQMKYNANPRDLIFKGFAPGIKFALGENVIRNENRYPNTRMGVESVLRLAFERARQYKADWKRYNELSDDEKAKTIPPRRDLRLEALQQVLDNELLVHCHCYNAGEILMLLQTFTRYGIDHLTLEHGLEAFKVAPEVVSFGKNGAHLSTFADFWGYKVEAYDAVPYNVAVITAAGGVAILNSDSGERVRRLNHDAAKMVRWGGISYQDAIRTITLNPAIALRLDDVVGSIEVGKKADLALFNGHPLNTFARPFMTLIDGEVVFERGGERGGPYPLEDKSGVQASLPEVNADGVYAIKNAMVYPVSAPPIPNGTIVIRDGKIASVGGGDTAVPDGATVVDGSNLQVYPGLIDGGSTVAVSDLGLSDAAEQGEIKASLEVATALKPDSPLIGIARFTGLTSSVTTPSSGLVSGQSALVQFDGWNFDELAYVPQLALEMALPSKKAGNMPAERRRFGPPRREPDEEQSDRPVPETSPYDRVIKLFADAREYDRIKQAAQERGKRGPDFDSQLEAVIPFARKEKPVVIRVRSATDILDAIDFAKELDIKAVLRDQGTESWKVADKIKEAGIPILISSVTQSVSSSYDPYDTVYSLPAKLHEAGVLFAFYTGSNTHARDLPLSAGIAVGFGLPEDAAIAALTGNTARIFGVDDQVGTLDVGKRADIIVTDRSPLQATSNVIHMFIGGKPIDVDDNMHTDLYKKYMKRLKRHGAELETSVPQ